MLPTDDRGRVYIDGASGVLTSNLGHANRDIVDAVAAQLGRLAFGAPTAATTTRALELVERMRALLPPQYTTMKFLSGGSEATETALKLARQYHRQTGHAGKYKVIAHYRGYHGGTGHALAASGWAHWKTAYEPYAAGFIHLSTPDPDRAPFAASSPEETGQLYAQLAEEAIALEDPETVAAVIIEPIMFSAGVVVPPDSYPNWWDNPFSNQTALFRMSDGSSCRVNEFRRIGHPEVVRMRLFGTQASFEESVAGAVWLTKERTATVRLDDVLAPSGVTTTHGHYAGLASVHPAERLPAEFAAQPSGHAGSHQFLVDDFVRACTAGTIPPNNVWVAARYAVPGIVAHESALRDGELLEVPDFGNPPGAGDRVVSDLSP